MPGQMPFFYLICVTVMNNQQYPDIKQNSLVFVNRKYYEQNNIANKMISCVTNETSVRG